MPDGRVLIALDDGPLEPSPTWTRFDAPSGDIPDQFVAGFDCQSGRQTLLAQTDTGTGTVYINDHKTGLFDPRNSSSPYFGDLEGKQIMLQLYDPVADAWEPQFRGHINDLNFDIDGSAVNAAGQPINASIQIDCVDIFDYLAGFGLTPGYAGVEPTSLPEGYRDGVYYAETSGTNHDRILEIYTDACGATWAAAMAIIASGNVHVKAVKYDPDESALTAIRDAADADLPFIANCYVNRSGQLVFRGRYSRFYPDEVAAEPGSDWDFARWAAGDGKAILADPTRAQMRVLSFARQRSELINAAIAYPQDLLPADMPDQVFADTSSISTYGMHSAPPMSDLLVASGAVTGNDAKTECFLYAKLLVKNKATPRVAVTALQLKSIMPTDSRAEETWAVMTKADVSHILNVAVGYPGGTGLTGNSPADDHYIEGRKITCRPLNPTMDYVEVDLNLTPFAWSADTHNVFPNPFS